MDMMNKKAQKQKNQPVQNGSKAARKGLVMVALGGIGEIGGNCYAYGFNDQWIIVDYGIAFPNQPLLGIDVELPDPSFFDNKTKNILAIIVTHAHEDHIGGISHLWDRFQCPVYATKFAKTFLEHKLRESDFQHQVPVHELHDDQELHLDVFGITAVAVSHSIPEARLLAINTPQGLIVHSGDWNGDDAPILNETNYDKLDSLAEQGVLAVVGDSTNVMTTTADEDMLTEVLVAENLDKAVASCKGRIIVTCFASNVARMMSIAAAGRNNGRQIALVGRSMWRMNTVAREVGYFDGVTKFKSASDLTNTPDRECLYIVTGSQGEPRAALTRIAQGSHPELRLKPKDTILYSSREIPGNEKSISSVHNNLALMGVRVVNADQAGIHASGHATRPQVARFLKRLKPQILVPVHGEGRHLMSHIALAKECQIPKSVLLQNGEFLRFSAEGDAEIIGAFDAGKLSVDGNRYIRSDSPIIRERKRIAAEGVISIAIAVDEFGDLAAEPDMSVLGLLEEADERTYDVLYEALENACKIFESHGALNKQCEAVEKTMRQQARKLLGKRPWVQVLMVEV